MTLIMESEILIVLALIAGVWSGNWGVELESQCAVRGTSVVIKCKYDYPFPHIVNSVSWYKAQLESGKWRFFIVSNQPSSPDHFTYAGNYRGDCSLQINNVRDADDGYYFFRFVTTFNKWTSKQPARLSVTDLTSVVQPSTVTEGDYVRLNYVTSCPAPVNIVWFRDGQRVRNPVFRARREDGGRYHCAVEGQETVKSASVALNVQYPPEKVTLSVSPLGDVVKGSLVTFACSSDASPPVNHSGYRLYKDGQLVRRGQSLTVSDIQPSDSGLYRCQAWNSVSRRGIQYFNSTDVHLDVQYHPVNVSISMNPPHVTVGSTVNLTCSSDANPAADNYTWYRRTDPTGSMLQVGSGQVLSIPSVEASHTGLYLCRARNQLGESDSTGVQLTMMADEQDIQPLLIVTGVGVALIVTLLIALLFWRKLRHHAEKKTAFDFQHPAAADNQSSGVYVNIHPLPSILPRSAITTPHPEPKQDACEDDVTYSTVTIRDRKHLPHNTDKSLQGPRFKAAEKEDSVIYATVVKSS